MVEREDCVAGPLTNPEMLEPLLSLDNVCQEFLMNDGTKFSVLKNLSLSIKNLKYKPQIVSILGPSGAGKTTVLRIIAALDQPSSGRVLISDGQSEDMRDVRIGDVGVVFQKYPLFDHLNVLNNLMEPAMRIAKMDEKAAKTKALEYLDKFGLFQQSLSWPTQLSGGQRQRVAILQQLIANKYYIILDEPFSGLDPISITNVINLISEVANQHTLNTFIVITHDVTAALMISDHIYLLGRDRDEYGHPVPGARIIREYDLIYEGIAYQENIEDLPKFIHLRKQIKSIDFPKL